MLKYHTSTIYEILQYHQVQHIVIWCTIALFGLVILFCLYKMDKRIRELQTKE